MTLLRIQKALALVVGLFVFYTAATGPFESLIQRAVFVALVVMLGFSLYPLGAGKSWRPLGALVDGILCAATVAAAIYIVIHYDRIMTSLPWAEPVDMMLTAGLILAVLELSRRAVGWFFPALVLLSLAYAAFGNYLPGRLRHRGFDAAFITETLFLGDLGIWGMLTGVAATVIAAFVLFGAMLLHTGGGQAFMELAMRLGGRQPGGAAKIATIASGLFGMISGSAVANVATTGNLTIPLMIRLGYSRPLAAAVEAVASTGGQIAPPIMGAAAFVMAEILGMSYVTIALAAIIPAILYYLSVFVTVHLLAVKRNLALVPEDELPKWPDILAPRQILPVMAAMGGLGIGIWLGRSISTAAFYGVAALLLAYVLTKAGRMKPAEMGRHIIDGLVDAGQGLVIIGVLLAGAQILVSMVNMTGIGVTLSSLIVALAKDSAVLVAIIVAVICLILGMGLPTTAAYVLVAGVLAPAMTAVGIDPLASHLFVFYFATVSVITPPVCIAVFVGAGIAQTNWLPAAGEAVRLGAVTYIVPFLLLLYPGIMLQGGIWEIADGLAAGIVLVIALPALLVRSRLIDHSVLDPVLFLTAIVLAIWPHPISPFLAAAVLIAGWGFSRMRGRSLS